MSRQPKWTGPAVLALAVMLFDATASHAYRMSQGTNLGWATRAYGRTCNDIYGFDHWNTRTIIWYLNTSGQGAGKEGAIQQALITWSNAAAGIGSDYQLVWGGTTNASYGVYDGQNTIAWGTDPTCDRSSCHAITAVYLTSSGTPSHGNVIVESDILFNANPARSFQWMTNGESSANCWNTQNSYQLKIDTQGVATHELGHTLGIDHTELASLPPSPASPTMGSIGCTPEARTLVADDINALQCSENRYPFNPLYEGELQTVTCREISGWAWNRNKTSQNSMVEITYLQGNQETTDRVVSAGIGSGDHNFVYTTSPDYWAGRWTVGARYTGTGQPLPGSPQLLICKASIFTSQSPTENLPTGGQVYTVGTQFSSNRSGYITDLSFYRASGETGSNTLRLWDDYGNELASVTPGCNYSGWCSGAIWPVYITAGTRYRVTVNTNTYQAKTGCGLGGGITNDPLTAHSGYWAAGDTFPYNGSCSNFFVDVNFDM